MGQAMIQGIVAAQVVAPGAVVVTDTTLDRARAMADRHGVQVAATSRAATANAEVIVLAIKPGDVPAALTDLRGTLRPDQVVLSIAAGVCMASLIDGLAHPAVVRAMPNTPAQIGAGVTGWIASSAVDARGRANAAAVLRGIGRAIELDDESYLDMVTAVSGSGPGYIFLFLEALIDAGVHVGLPRPIAAALATETVIGAGLMARDGTTHPAALRNMVTSPGGTTAAGLAELEAGGLRAAVDRAVVAAFERSRALGRGEMQ